SGTASPVAGSTLTLAATSNTINCGRLDIDSGTAGATDILKLGAGSNNIGTTNLFIGAGLGGGEVNFRSNGSIQFNSASGTFTLRGGDANQNDNGLDNSGSSIVGMVCNGTSSSNLATSSTVTATMDLRNHMTDLQIN